MMIIIMVVVMVVMVVVMVVMVIRYQSFGWQIAFCTERCKHHLKPCWSFALDDYIIIFSIPLSKRHITHRKN